MELIVLQLARMQRFTCTRCAVVFTSRQALGGHRNGVLTCVAAAAAEPAPAVTQAVMQELQAVGEQEVNDNGDMDTDNGAVASQEYSVAQLLQRATNVHAKHIIQDVDVRPAEPCNIMNTYKLHETQFAYDEYIAIVRSNYSDEFWRVFASVYRERVVIIDGVLQACKRVLVPRDMKKQFAVRICIYDIIYEHAYMVNHIRTCIYGHPYIVANI